MKIPEAFEFTYTPYKIQEDFMKELYRTLDSAKCGIFESPTGTGKSLSIICSAIRWLKDCNLETEKSIELQINELVNEKALEESKNETDWINTQAKTIEITRTIDKLKIELDLINLYYRSIEEVKNNSTKKQKNYTKLKMSNQKIISGPDELSNKTIDTNEDDDYLIDQEVLNKELLEEEEEEIENEAKFKPIKVFICSRTHSQLSQLVAEIKKSPFAANIRVVSLASRQNYCINPEVTKLKNISLINERCLDMQKSGSKSTKQDDSGRTTKRKKSESCKCPFYQKEAIEDLRDAVVSHVQDVEDLVSTGKEFQACPYYASRRAVEYAEVVLVPYNTILHKATREANGIELKNSVVIIDEAHNLLEALAQMYGASINLEQLKLAQQQLKSYKTRYSTKFSAANMLCINQLIFIIGALTKQFCDSKELKTEIFSVNNFVVKTDIDNYNMFKLINFVKNSRLSQKLHGFVVKFPNPVTKKQEPNAGLKNFLKSIQKNKEEEKEEEKIEPEKPKISNPMLSIVTFLEALTNTSKDGRILLYHKEKKLQFLLLNPSKHFEDIVKDARSVIVAGGTMKPINEFRDRLFVNSGVPKEQIVEFSCDHIIPPENILPIIISNNDFLFNYENRFKMGNKVKQVLLDACKVVQGGIIAFFPSFKYETFVWNEIKTTDFGRPVFREPQQGCSVDTVLENYSKAIYKSTQKRALLLSVVGGKLSEGLNFNDDLGRCVIVFGLPYANIMGAELKEKMAFLENNEGPGAGKQFYENLCMKAVNQCIGRAVRHKNDYACVLLVDARYNRPSTKKALPDWIQRSLKVCQYGIAFENIRAFFKARR